VSPQRRSTFAEDTDPYAHLDVRTEALDSAGRHLLTYTPAGTSRSGRSWADGVWRPETVPVAEAAAVATELFSGWAVSTADALLAAALRARGADEVRHALVMSHDLSGSTPTGRPALSGRLQSPPVDRALDPRIRVWPLSAQQLVRHSGQLGQVQCNAYPPSHPDHRNSGAAASAAELRAIAAGEILGLLMAQSRVAVAEGALVGAGLVVDRPGRSPEGGPWVIDIFRDPDSPLGGIGRALLVDILAAAQADGLPALSLAVSSSNGRARRLYADLGFEVAEESWTLVVAEG